MLTYTDSIDLVWRIAAWEADWLNHEFIEREHVFDAFCKAHESLQNNETKKIKKELMPILDVLQACDIDPKELRRRVRGYVGKGEYKRAEGEVIHRSEECKQYFAKAEETARADGDAVVAPIHLMKTLLQDPGPHVEKTLIDLGTTTGEILELLIKEKKRVNEEVATPLLNRFCRNLSIQAQDGKLKPLVGRRDELLCMVRTLLLREKNNPVLVGEAGVGKTAIVEGLASRIASGNVNPKLHGKKIMELSLASLVAGTKYRGEFEERILGIIKEAKTNPDVILFIDEIHTLVGAGGAQGSLDASNIMKPMLARGEISVIGATTSEDYNRCIAKDHAFERRFQPITVEEPNPDETLRILEGLRERHEQEHEVRIFPEALKAMVDLSVRYLPYRRLPDKAVELMDKACVWVKVPTLSYHEEINDTECDEIDRNKMKGSPESFFVNAGVVAEVVAQETGVPLGRIKEDERDKLLMLAKVLGTRVIGQDEAVEKVIQFVKLARAGLRDSRRPMGIFLFLGPTGVGKTELSRALAETLFGSEDEMIRLDMSEYMEKHSVAKLIGAPPGYVGHEQGGQLTNRLKKKPYSVVLMDEIEKAHPEVFDILLQLFDEGRITDGRGQTMNARDTLFIMTSNIGARLWYREPIGFIDPNSENGKDVKKN
ncbi:MAG: ATP-dependent Clp protease ATP-binding subunit [Desulfobulbaceae bacterium]|nr:ATP-dependent Clp protease ATP-binding subunit [Desulfobulbaceae bacterium]